MAGNGQILSVRALSWDGERHFQPRKPYLEGFGCAVAILWAINHCL
jgi:hypothetical protein